MGMESKVFLPPYVSNSPTLHGAPVLRIDWSKPAGSCAGLVNDMVGKLARKEASTQQRIGTVSGHRARVDV